MQEVPGNGTSESVSVEIASAIGKDVLLERFGGDETTMKDVVSLFIDVVGEERKTIAEQIASRSDKDGCAKRVHNLASSVSPFGLSTLSRRCIHIESALLRGDWEQAQDGFEEIDFHLGKLIGALLDIGTD
ncbi:Hpt domain-containing protein [Oceanidesulfovibrio marinus]|nr:Hpt domain-containing protein [Oceanidesulfovibrio marinus]